ncbi:hypothetical protein [Candidatus Contubernalis alkaliaceticus]|uniref:hypothetical protein n=1 Tax=Candidatus Contubernalis alkaliaceticus TaxID=338645 RepID=UPI001F4C166A|nr:hypothetical protein [Candidatus Contubernalis alkalaceticus]UNC91790.1 hypothetical protein HUE98_06590 [Candidatus Contubernalis alkalaceticus]
METPVILTTVLFVTVVVLGLIVLKYLEKRLGFIRSQEVDEEDNHGVLNKPPTFRTLDDIDYLVEWFIRRDKRIDNPYLNSMNIVENLAEETKLELDSMKTKKQIFNRYLGDLVDFLPKVGKAEMVLTDHYSGLKSYDIVNNQSSSQEAEDPLEVIKVTEEVSLANMRSYITAKIRILGWIYYLVYKKWYNQRDSEFLDFTEYFSYETENIEKQ